MAIGRIHQSRGIIAAKRDVGGSTRYRRLSCYFRPFQAHLIRTLTVSEAGLPLPRLAEVDGCPLLLWTVPFHTEPMVAR